MRVFRYPQSLSTTTRSLDTTKPEQASNGDINRAEWKKLRLAEGSWNRNVSELSDKSNISEVSTAYSLEELSTSQFFQAHCCEIDTMASKVVDTMELKDALRQMMEAGNFFITVVDPRSDDAALIAVSGKFEVITGWSNTEVLGQNCRFLNAGSPSSLEQKDLMGLRAACQTGESYTTVFTNRRKSGALFLNALDMRGITVARNPKSGEDLWFLVGIQADVTELGTQGILEEHLHELHEVANGIRGQLTDKLSAMAIAGALRSNYDIADFSQPCGKWRVLPQATWRPSGSKDFLDTRREEQTRYSWLAPNGQADIRDLCKVGLAAAACGLAVALIVQGATERRRSSLGLERCLHLWTMARAS
eukprot:TRINITY_DN33762_c0_g1_i1.p1 TRINITY_DN33762_c0_g1~~TRINITY_DN33762_c0_g1_i1.p1  ORF type:complete len:362 (-),score=65.96 TRINITY_DN33762_c0_g1_i1:149-1234(-)